MEYVTHFEKLEREYVRAAVFKCTLSVPCFTAVYNKDYPERQFVAQIRYSTGQQSTLEWSLDLNFLSRSGVTDDRENMILSIKNPNSFFTNYTIASEKSLYVLNNEGEEMALINSNPKAKEKKYEWTDFSFLRTPLMENPEVFLPNNYLKLVCYVHVDVPIPTSKQIKFSEQPKMKYFSNFIEDDEFSDVTLVVENQEFRAHKIFLSARSPVFAAMFRNEMKEKHENRVQIDDIDCDTLKAMLQYIYTNEVTNLHEVVANLLIAADKYELNSLKAVCEKHFSECITLSNAKEILHFANRYNAERLVKYTRSFLEIINPPKPDRKSSRKNRNM